MYTLYSHPILWCLWLLFTTNSYTKLPKLVKVSSIMFPCLNKTSCPYNTVLCRKAFWQSAVIDRLTIMWMVQQLIQTVKRPKVSCSPTMTFSVWIILRRLWENKVYDQFDSTKYEEILKKTNILRISQYKILRISS